MKTSKDINKYYYVLEMLKSVGQEHQAILDRILSENPENKRSFLYRLKKNTENVTNTNNPVWAYKIIVETVAEYIQGYHAPASSKQVIYKLLYALCKDIGKRNDFSDSDTNFLDDLSDPVETDFDIDLIKLLHPREGITKEEILQKLPGATHERTVQNHIQALSGYRKPLRIGGFAVHVPVVRKKKEGRDKPQKFYTPNTMNPVVLLMNTTQTATLLQSFYYNNEKGNIIPLDMAIDTWCQLSDYTKARIREIFCKDDPDFASFLDQVEAESESLSYRFMTESELLSQRDTSAGEKLDLAYKGGLICDLELCKPTRSRKHQRIMRDDETHSYYAVSAENLSGDRLYFDKDELCSLAESF